MAYRTITRSQRRKKRVSANISGTQERPRIAIYRSNKYIYAQAIDDMGKTTISSFSALHLKKKNNAKMNKVDQAKQIGIELGALLKEKKITAGVFDRGRFAYKGRVKALAEGLREAGLQI